MTCEKLSITLKISWPLLPDGGAQNQTVRQTAAPAECYRGKCANDARRDDIHNEGDNARSFA